MMSSWAEEIVVNCQKLMLRIFDKDFSISSKALRCHRQASSKPTIGRKFLKLDDIFKKNRDSKSRSAWEKNPVTLDDTVEPSNQRTFKSKMYQPKSSLVIHCNGTTCIST